MIRVTHIIESFEQLQELTRNPKYTKVVFKTDKNKNLRTCCKAWVYYKFIDNNRLGIISNILEATRSEFIPTRIREILGGYYSHLNGPSPFLTVGDWKELIQIEKEFSLKLDIPKSLKKEIKELCSNL